jgi:hypothetical protein
MKSKCPRSLRSVLVLVWAAGAMLALNLFPVGAQASRMGSHSRVASAKSVSLRLSDVQHVFRGTFSASGGRYTTPHAIGVCTTTPPATDYTTSFFGPLRTKGVENVISDVYTYKSNAGPRCNQKFEISEAKALGGTLGRMYKAGGVGEEAFILDTTGPKSPGPPVYTLALKFTRGLYRAIIIVQSGKIISHSDMIKLGKIVDERMKHSR